MAAFSLVLISVITTVSYQISNCPFTLSDNMKAIVCQSVSVSAFCVCVDNI